MSFTYDWFSHNIPSWEQHLKHLEGRTVRALEIGCFEGRATRWLLENVLTHAESHITVCDTFAGSLEHHDGTFDVDVATIEEVFNAEVMGLFPHKVTKRKGTSFATLMALNSDPGTAPSDLIYIDGSHLAKDVMADALLSWNLLKPGGILIFDDYALKLYSDPALTPKLAIDGFLAMFAHDIRLLHKGYQVIVQRMPAGQGSTPSALP